MTYDRPEPWRVYAVPSLNDPALLSDPTVLNRMLKMEKWSPSLGDYFSKVQVVVRKHMRKTLTEWMHEVCEEERCDCEVFPLAVQYLDRFLAKRPMRVEQLQTLGTACLLTASKMLEAQPVAASRLVQYTDCSVELDELLAWELILVKQLNWDICLSTAHSFLDHYLFRLNVGPAVEQRLRPQLRLLIALAATEYRFAVLPQSVIAASCLCVALINLLSEPGAIETLAAQLDDLTSVESDTVMMCTRQMIAFIMELRQAHFESSAPCIEDAEEDSNLDQRRMACRIADCCRPLSQLPCSMRYA